MPVQEVLTFRVRIGNEIVTDRTLGACLSCNSIHPSYNVLEICELDNLLFKRPLPVQASYDDQDGCWCLKNEHLSLSGYGKTCQEALISLSDHLESLLVEFFAFEDAALSGKSQQIKKRLQTYLDLNNSSRRFDKITVEVYEVGIWY